MRGYASVLHTPYRAVLPFVDRPGAGGNKNPKGVEPLGKVGLFFLVISISFSFIQQDLATESVHQVLQKGNRKKSVRKIAHNIF